MSKIKLPKGIVATKDTLCGAVRFEGRRISVWDFVLASMYAHRKHPQYKLSASEVWAARTLVCRLLEELRAK